MVEPWGGEWKCDGLFATSRSQTRMYLRNRNGGKAPHRQAGSPSRERQDCQAKGTGLTAGEFKQRHAALAELLCHRRIEAPTRAARCELIGQRVIAASPAMDGANFTRTVARDLTYMAELYDDQFLDGHLLALARHFGMRFRWSKRMTSNGGKTVRTMGRDPHTRRPFVRYEIVLSATLLFQTFADLRRPVRVSGVLCCNRLQAMQRILEHELVHLAEMLVWGDSCCAAARFHSIAGRLFGHTEHKHELITQLERAQQKFNVTVGSHVEFSMAGKRLAGTVNRITRRATVLVPDPQGQLYDDGRRYTKYYVPLSHLRVTPLRPNKQ
ncbi:MAG: hypothetical protein KatS3mg111_3102 [Pirellulaceae bacterium]|nr:MAG: hypothetical protein KatS3mg111_3102 [Pirellulaceae bacterium]